MAGATAAAGLLVWRRRPSPAEWRQSFASARRPSTWGWSVFAAGLLALVVAAIGGLGAGTGFDAYQVAGKLTLGGTLKLVSWDGYVLQPGITVPAGATSVKIAEDGIVTATLAGQTTPQSLGTIQLASFINPAGLDPKGGNLYGETAASGTPSAGAPQTNNLGSLQRGFLEGLTQGALQTFTLFETIAVQAITGIRLTDRNAATQDRDLTLFFTTGLADGGGQLGGALCGRLRQRYAHQIVQADARHVGRRLAGERRSLLAGGVRGRGFRWDRRHDGDLHLLHRLGGRGVTRPTTTHHGAAQHTGRDHERTPRQRARHR